MSIEVHCTSCTSEFHVSGEFSGKLIRCPSCKEPVRVPSTSSESSSPVVSAVPPKRSDSSKSMNVASSPDPETRKQPARQAQRRPTRTRSAASKPAARDRSFDAPNRRSAQGKIARRKRKRQSQGNFPVGLAVGLGVGIAGLLIAVVVMMSADKDTDELMAESTDNGTSQTSEVQSGQDDFQSSTPSNHNEGGNSFAGSTESPLSIASNQPSNPSLTNFSALPDTSGLPSPNSGMGGRNQPSMGQESTASDTPNTAGASQSVRPPILDSWSDVNTLVGPSIVRVDVKLSGGGGQGSGYVVDAEKGVAVTNYHVVEGALDAQISFENGDRIQVDGFLFLDSKRDIAMLKFDPLQSTQAKLRGLPLAKAHPLKGEEVAAFGAPVGLDFSMTQNIISAIRPAKDMAKMIGLTDVEGTWLQHGVSISSGNSGGPLINKRGEVVGMNTLGLTIGQNLNFAISGLDVTDGYNSQLPKMLAVSPSSAPVRHRPGSSGPDGSFDDPYESPEIQIVDVAGEERGEKLLAKMKSLTILSIEFSDDPSGTVTGAVRSEARKAIERCKIKLTSSRGGDYVMLMVMELERSGNKNTLRMTSQILTKDDDAREVLKIWELTEDVGTLSMQSIIRRYLPPNLKKDIQKYFAKVRLELITARRKYAAEDDTNN